MGLLQKIFFKDNIIRTFFITRLQESQVEEKVFLKQGGHTIDITKQQGMICLDPFCVAAWLSTAEVSLISPGKVKLLFKKGDKINASVKVSLIEKMPTTKGALLLYEIEGVQNHQLSALRRLALFAWFLRSKTNTLYSRRVISALYSYPRKIIIVSYRDEGYCNIFPMDIQGYIEEEGLYILGLRTTNMTLNKILEAKKVVVCDTNGVELNTVYNLGKHPSKEPTPIDKFPFSTFKSERFGFPVPDFCGSYKEIEIVEHKKMGVPYADDRQRCQFKTDQSKPLVALPYRFFTI